MVAPLSAGAVHATATWPSPGVRNGAPGASGGPAGVAAAVGDHLLVPWTLRAWTRTSCRVPLASPVMVACVEL